MSASLVGSEMCIRDRFYGLARLRLGFSSSRCGRPTAEAAAEPPSLSKGPPRRPRRAPSAPRGRL
eukprot:8207591-Alexandrium_andersonii.AAC.1